MYLEHIQSNIHTYMCMDVYTNLHNVCVRIASVLNSEYTLYFYFKIMLIKNTYFSIVFKGTICSGSSRYALLCLLGFLPAH